jgi:hypothetical protein
VTGASLKHLTINRENRCTTFRSVDTRMNCRTGSDQSATLVDVLARRPYSSELSEGGSPPAAPSTLTPWPSSPTLGPSTGAVTAPCPAQTPPPNPDCCRTLRQTVLSGVRVADHEVTLKAPWTGSGWREHSYGGFGGGHSPFHRAFRLSPTQSHYSAPSAWEVTAGAR